MRPVLHAGDESVLHRIDVTVLDMPSVIGFVANEMLPEPSLPDATLTARQANRAQSLLFRQRLRETSLDQAPSC